MTVDFHVHSTASDGTFEPAAVAGMAAKGTFAAIALTDHDNTEGIAEFLSGPGLEVRRFAGIELDVEPGEGFDQFHLLGLGIEPSTPELNNLLEVIRAKRDERNAGMVSRFRAVGIDMPEDPREGAGPSTVIARPHFASWLVRHGYAHTVPEAFAKYLTYDSPSETNCYVQSWNPPQEDALAAIHAAGGLAVMAHPRFWKRAWKHGCDFAAAERGLAELVEKGLDGLESLYQVNTPEENVEFTRMADRLGLVKSAGSDFHGAVKPGIRLGMEVADSFIAPLLEQLEDCR